MTLHETFPSHLTSMIDCCILVYEDFMPISSLIRYSRWQSDNSMILSPFFRPQSIQLLLNTCRHLFPSSIKLWLFYLSFFRPWKITSWYVKSSGLLSSGIQECVAVWIWFSGTLHTWGIFFLAYGTYFACKEKATLTNYKVKLEHRHCRRLGCVYFWMQNAS